MAQIINPKKELDLLEKYKKSLIQLGSFYHLLKIMGARFFKVNPDDKIFHDGTFTQQTVDDIKEISKLDWDVLNNQHGKDNEGKQDIIPFKMG